MIDTHCHIDQYPSPEAVVSECEREKVRVIAVTNLPSHYAIAADRLRGNKFVSAALGVHPLFAEKGVRELSAFKMMARQSDFIGEIGLDFSRRGAATKTIQERVFEDVLRAVSDRPRFITLHSRGAELAVLQGLRRHAVRAAVFHWFSGSVKLLNEVFADGHFVSFNPAMLSTANGVRIIQQSPPERVLVESDGPFTKLGNHICRPTNIGTVYDFLAETWGVSRQSAAELVRTNFHTILKRVTSGSLG